MIGGMIMLCKFMVVKSPSVPELSIVFGEGEHDTKMQDALIGSGMGRDGHGIAKTDALVLVGIEGSHSSGVVGDKISARCKVGWGAW